MVPSRGQAWGKGIDAGHTELVTACKRVDCKKKIKRVKLVGYDASNLQSQHSVGRCRQISMRSRSACSR